MRREPTLVCGDFNHWWNTPVRGLVRRALHDTGTLLGRTVRTYPSGCPVLRLDRVHVDGGVLPLSIDAGRGALARVASDHLPLVLRFGLRDEGVPPSPPVLLHG